MREECRKRERDDQGASADHGRSCVPGEHRLQQSPGHAEPGGPKDRQPKQPQAKRRTSLCPLRKPFPPRPDQAVDDQQQSLVGSKHDVEPVGAMPQPNEHHRDHQVPGRE